MKLIKLLKKLNGLKNVPRVGWSLAGISKVEVEDVAQHSFDVVYISLLLTEELKKVEFNWIRKKFF